MFGYPGNDANELQNQYNFGELESAANRPRAGTTPQQQPGNDEVSPAEIHVSYGNDEPEFSPRDYDGGDGAATPMSPAAFGQTEGAYAVTHGPGGAAAPVNGGEKTNGNKKHVIKEVFGVGRKSTKGKTDEEKEQIALEQRWKNAQAEEQRLNELEKRVATGEARTDQIGKIPNLPRKFLCLKPLVYHNIEDEVAPSRQKFVTIAFWNWVAVSILLVMNCAIAIGVGFAPYKSEEAKKEYPFNKALNTVLAAVYLVGIPLAFISWYWRIYRACSTARPAQHLTAIFALIIGLAQSIFAFIGPRGYGVCGIQMAIHIGKSRVTGAVVPIAIMILLWMGEAGMMCFLIVKEWIFYRHDLAARRAARRHIDHSLAE